MFRDFLPPQSGVAIRRGIGNALVSLPPGNLLDLCIDLGAMRGLEQRAALHNKGRYSSPVAE